MAARQGALVGLEVTEVVADGDLSGYIRKAHKRGGRLRRSSPASMGATPAYAVTMVYPL